ncbi:MAG: inositol monophosphatase [Acidiferrobacterales bacterium]|nr:inositol monophosphatase [Acidiferrobacterales bacterium]
MDNYLKLAIEAATAAGDYISDAAGKLDQLEVTQKKLHDYVSDVDRNAEKIITSTLLTEFPGHSILGEEFGESAGCESDYHWIIDPLDGTTNFLRSIPHYAVSIALQHKGVLAVGVVLDVPKGDLFFAQRGMGAYLNHNKITVSERISIEGALLATGVPFNGENLKKISSFTSTMENLLGLQTSGIRRLGAAALDLAYIACGRYDGFWEANLQAWDIAAGALLVTESGGVVSDLNGESDYLNTGNVLAANKSVHKSMLAITSKCYASD